MGSVFLRLYSRKKCIADINFQISVIPGGATSMGSVTSQVKPAQTGPQHGLNVDKKTQSLLMSTTMKKMFTYSIAIMETNPGWV